MKLYVGCNNIEPLHIKLLMVDYTNVRISFYFLKDTPIFIM